MNYGEQKITLSNHARLTMSQWSGLTKRYFSQQIICKHTRPIKFTTLHISSTVEPKDQVNHNPWLIVTYYEPRVMTDHVRT